MTPNIQLWDASQKNESRTMVPNKPSKRLRALSHVPGLASDAEGMRH